MRLDTKNFTFFLAGESKILYQEDIKSNFSLIPDSFVIPV